MMRSTRFGQGAGYTLTEIMFALGIVGMLLLIGIPNFLVWNSKAKLKDSVGLMSGNLNLARMSAINQNTTVTITITQASASFPYGATVTFRNGSGIDVVQPLALDAQVSLTDASDTALGGGSRAKSPQSVAFTAMGLRQDTGNANNNCLLPNSGSYDPAGCTSSSTQAFNFMNTYGLNYRLVVTSTGKTSWCYASGCAQ